MNILLIEDEAPLALDIIEYLTKQNYNCHWVDSIDDATDALIDNNFSCILLDLMLKNEDGLEFINRAREIQNTAGILIISAKNSIPDRVLGLQLGADDYLSKPFHLSELVARIFSLIRRLRFDSCNVIDQGPIHINITNGTVKINNQELSLTKMEYSLLLYFVSNQNRVISKEAIADHLSKDFSNSYDDYDFVYAHIKNLRRKIQHAGGGKCIKTIYGIGYKWKQDEKQN